MTGLPTLLVKLDDGSGSFPYDVSAFVRLPGGMSITRGRTDEFNQVQPSTLSIVFDNTTGVFTLGSGTYGIVIDQRIQVTETVSGAVKRFTGYVQDWPVAWPDGSDTFAVATVTAVDRLSRLARRKLQATAAHEILLDAPQWYWPCTEPQGSVAAGDLSGNTGPSLVPKSTGADVDFAAGTLGVDGLPAPVMADGKYLAAVTPLTLGSSATSWTFEFSFETTIPGATTNALAFVGLDFTGQWEMYLDSSGRIVFHSLTGTNNLADGVTHHVAYTYTGGTSTLYVDGVSIGTPGITDPGGSTVEFRVGDAAALGVFEGTIGQAAFHTSALSAARILAHANAIRNGLSSDTADQRIARLASYAKIATADQSLETGQQPSIAAQATTGQSVLDAMQNVMEAEGGLVFIQGDGKLVMQNKSHRAVRAVGSAALAMTADQINPDVSMGGAKNYLTNTATGSRDGGAQQRAVNTASVTAYEEYATDLSRALLPTDDLVLDVLNWTTATYSTPRPRLPAFTIDLLTTASATVQTILGLEIGDLITASGLPSQTPASLGGLLVEGWTENLTHDTWEITLNTVPSALFRGPIVDTAGATCDTGYPVYF